MTKSKSVDIELLRLLQAAKTALEDKRYKEAHAHCMSALKIDPSRAEPYHLLGLLAADHSNFAKALQLQDRALSMGHAPAAPNAQAARCLIALSRRSDAVERAKIAAAENPKDAHTLDTIGVVFSRAGRHEEAVQFYHAATSLAPRVASYRYNLGAALQFIGDFDNARLAFDECLELNPADARARVARVSITEQRPNENDVSELEKAWRERDLTDTDATLQLSHALAKAHEDLGDFTGAMKWLERGKREKRKTIVSRSDKDDALFETAKKLIGSLQMDPGSEQKGPIFIVGMPRTGTTLVDRILGSHSQVSSAGELSDFSIILKRHARTPGRLVLDPNTLLAAQHIDLASVGRKYLDQVADTLDLRDRFTDKMPLNIFFAPAILAALPGAQIVCLRRHPADTVLSNYRQLFATAFSYYTYAYDLESTAHYVSCFNRLVDAYIECLSPTRFLCVDYESIVTDLENETKRVLDFCGLDFEARCLDFHKNRTPVATASSAQVRKPIYTSSIGKWRYYRPAIDPALSILIKAGLMTKGDLATRG